MFHINVWLTVKNPVDIPKVRDLLVESARLSRPEPGCSRFDVYHSEGDAKKFLLCEHWESKKAWEIHKEAEAFTTIYQPQVLPLVDREPHFSEMISSS